MSVGKMSVAIFYYLFKIIQEFWLAKSCRWNHHIRSVAAQIWNYDITVEYWKQTYHVWRHFNVTRYDVTLIYAAYVSEHYIVK
jgi:hypothetical protein